MKNFLVNMWRGLNKRIALIASIILVVCCAVCIAAGVYLKQPEVVAIKSVERFARDAADRDEVKYLEKILKGGSIESSMSSLKLNDEKTFKNSSLYGKIFFSDDAVMLDNIQININGTKIEGGAYFSEKLAYVNENEILSGTYGARLDELADDLKNSIFAYGSGSEYAIDDEETYNSLIDALERPIDEKLMGDAEKLANRYIKDIYKIICDNADFDDKNDTVRINGEKIKARIVTVSLDEDDLSDILYDIYNYLENDKRMIKFLEKHENALRPYLSDSIAEEDNDKSLAELYKEYIEELEDDIDDACKNIKDQAIDLEIEIVTPKSSAKLLRLAVNSSDEEIAVLDIGKDGIKKTNEVNLTINDSTVKYEIKQNDRNGYKSLVKANDETLLSFMVDKERNDLEFFIGDKDTNITIKGDISIVSGSATIDIKEITRNYKKKIPAWGTTAIIPTTDVYETDLRIIIREKDKMPKPVDDFKTIDEITDEDIEKWLNKINK